jgi:hypothetical protein
MFQLPPARLFQEVFAFFPRSLCISRDNQAMNGIAILLGTTHTHIFFKHRIIDCFSWRCRLSFSSAPTNKNNFIFLKFTLPAQQAAEL